MNCKHASWEGCGYCERDHEGDLAVKKLDERDAALRLLEKDLESAYRVIKSLSHDLDEYKAGYDQALERETKLGQKAAADRREATEIIKECESAGGPQGYFCPICQHGHGLWGDKVKHADDCALAKWLEGS